MTTNTTNTTNVMIAGTGGNSANPGTGWMFPDRIDLPFVEDPNVDNQRLLPIRDKGYSDASWDAVWYAWRALTEYVRTPWHTIALDPPNLKPAAVKKEIETLVGFAQFQRADALPEILAQKDEFISYFMQLLSATPGSHPATYRVLHMANLFAAFTVMYFKAQFKRQRPSQLCSVLLPPVDVPGHASYPSGHSTQGHLIALCAGFVLPATMQPLMQGNLKALADRIALNREIAGLHYPSDTDAGVQLATRIAGNLDKDCGTRNPRIPCYCDTVTAAKAEWRRMTGEG